MPVSMRLGWRLRHTSTAVPSALRPSASRRKRTLLTERSTSAGTSDEVLCIEAPLGAARPGLALPDRHRRLEGVDAEPSSLERLLSVGRRRGDHHRGLADRERPGAVEQGEPAGGRPAAAGLDAICRKAGHDLLLIGLVFELPHGVSTLGVVTGGAREHHDCTAIRPDRPVVHDARRQHPSVSSNQVSLWLGGSSTRSC